MHSSDEHLSSTGSKQRQSLPARSFANYDEPKSNVQLKEASSDEDDEENSTLDNFDTNNDRFKLQHLSLDYDAGHLSPASAYQQQQQQDDDQQTPGSSKKGRSLSIASVLSPLSPSNSSSFAKKNVPQFLTVSPTFTPRARPPPAYANNFAGGSRPALMGPSTSPRMNSPSPSRPANPALAVSGQMPSFEAAKGGILGGHLISKISKKNFLSSLSPHSSPLFVVETIISIRTHFCSPSRFGHLAIAQFAFTTPVDRRCPQDLHRKQSSAHLSLGPSTRVVRQQIDSRDAAVGERRLQWNSKAPDPRPAVLR